MKKNIKIVAILMLSLLLTSCGFKTVNQKYNNIIYIKNIKITGEQRIAHSLRNNILMISNSKSKNIYNADIEIQKQTTSKIKDQSGKITRYSLSISTNLELINLNNNSIIQKTIVRSEDYDVATTHSATINNEANTTKNIISLLSEDIINLITLAMRLPWY